MREAPPKKPVTIVFDGERIQAEEGEPIAAALVAAGKLQLARSPKFHRPRGPYCLRGGCDGCLSRVDGEPNVMTCLAPAREGSVVESQNTLGTRELDLLRVSDWFFQKGMNHHELFAGVPGLQQVMQALARRVAGLGTLPRAVEAQRAARRREVDVLVVGAGPSGMQVATELAAKGREPLVIDDATEPGGVALALGMTASLDAFRRAVDAGKVALSSRAVAGGIFGDDVLVVGLEGAEILTARAVVLAPGAHDGVLAFDGNDLPGVMSARALASLAARGVRPGEKIAIVAHGAAPYAKRLLERWPDRVTLVRGEPVAVKGSSHPKGLVVRDGGKERTVDCDLVGVDAPPSPAYELCAQAGAELAHEPRGWIPKTEGGRIRPGFFAAGEVAGVAAEETALAADASRVARAVLA